jgi:tight adherence protein B
VTDAWYWLGRTGGALLCAALAAAAASLCNPHSPLRAFWGRYLTSLKGDLDFIQARCTAAQLATAQLGLLFLGVASLLFGARLPAALAFAVALSPKLVLRRLREQRITLIEQQIEAWLVALSNALKASPSLGDSLLSTIALMRNPIACEIDRVMKEYQLGTSLDQALHNASLRIGSRTFTMALSTLRIARNTGGDLSETLGTSAKSLREMARLEGVVRTKTAEGKAQALVISAIPIPLYFLISWMQPGFFEPLKHTFTGHVVCALAALFWVSAALLAQRILNVDI